jgi:hypothetical protein
MGEGVLISLSLWERVRVRVHSRFVCYDSSRKKITTE